MADPEEPNKDHRQALRWYWERWLLLWGKINQADTRLHEALYKRFPTSMRIGGRVLRGFYGLSVSPAFAVILTLLLVGLVISDVVPLIVSISVFVAWLVAILSVAKAECVNRLGIARRVIVVFGLAALMAFGANRYVRWCLVNYYQHHQAGVKPHDDTDKLAYERFKELIHEEMPKYVQIGPAMGLTHDKPQTMNQPKADVIIDFAGKQDLLMMFKNTSTTPAEKPKHWFGMIDATNMFTWPNKPDEYQPLPLPAQTWEKDYIRKDLPTGPYSVLSESSDKSAEQHVKLGDIIVGMIGVTCINCQGARRYYVYFEVGAGGWFYQIPQNKEPLIPMPHAKTVSLKELNEFLDKQVPVESRIAIKERFN